MDPQQRNLDTVRRIYSLVGKAVAERTKVNAESIMEQVDDTVKLETFSVPTKAQEAGVFYLMPREGKDGFWQFLLDEGLEFQRFDIQRMLAVEEFVLVYADLAMTIRKTGKHVRSLWIREWSFNEAGLVVGFRHWGDTAAHIEANRPDPNCKKRGNG